MMRFSLSMQTSELTPAIGISNFTSLICMMMLGFGIMFQLPIIVLFLTISGMIKLETLKKLRPIVLVVILVLSALLTPPDVISQLMMGLPTYLLFELSLFISSVALRSKKKTGVEVPTETPAPTQKAYAESEDFFSSSEESEPGEEGYSEDYKSRKTKRKMRYISRR
jgi:sec-independent protein translocase protein TatC